MISKPRTPAYLPASNRKLRTVAASVVVSLLTVLLAVSWAHANFIRSTILLVVQPSPADAAVWNLAREALSRVDPEALEILGEREEFASLSDRYFSLKEKVDSDQGATSYYELKGVDVSLARAFQNGNLTQAALFSASREVIPMTAEEAQALSIERVEVSRQLADHKALQDQITAFNAEFDALSDTDVDSIRGDLSTYVPELPSELLTSFVSRGGDLGKAAQRELDQRLADSLPDLSKQSNGLVDPDLLCTIPWAPADQILCAALPNLQRLSDAYKAEFGTDIPILDGYRPLSEQQTVYARDPNWTAVPGTSNHGWGLAVDLGWDTFREWDAPEVRWMLDNGYKYGWRLPSALNQTSDRPEPWHYEFGTSYSGDDAADFTGPTPDVIYRVPLPKQP